MRNAPNAARVSGTSLIDNRNRPLMRASTTNIGGLPSYTELITCLAMRRDVQKLRAPSSDKPEGDGAAGARRKRR
jgi:hypothetical protein